MLLCHPELWLVLGYLMQVLLGWWSGSWRSSGGTWQLMKPCGLGLGRRRCSYWRTRLCIFSTRGICEDNILVGKAINDGTLH